MSNTWWTISADELAPTVVDTVESVGRESQKFRAIERLIVFRSAFLRPLTSCIDDDF